MSWDDCYNDPYHAPNKFGLEIINEMDDPDACYSFDMFVLWRQPTTGRLFYAQDSGCSCPSPFEDYLKLDDLTELTDDTWQEFENEVKDWCSWQTGSIGDAAQVERTDMLRKADKALREKGKR